MIRIDKRTGLTFDVTIAELFFDTWVVAALKEIPINEHRPNPAATESATNKTPASPTAPWDLVQSHRSMVKQA